MPSEIPPSPIHLGPAQRRALAKLPIEIRAALALDHLRSLEELDETLLRTIEEGLATVVEALDEPGAQELRRLEELTRERRVDEIRSATPGEYASVALARRLRDKAVAALPGRPDASLHWAELCGLVARRGSTPAHKEWRVHGLFLVANAHRARRDFDAAQRWFKRAAAQRATVRRKDPELCSEQEKFLASWRLDCGDLPGSLRAASWSANFAKRARQPHRHGRAGLMAFRIRHQAKEFRGAVSDAIATVGCFTPAIDAPLLALMARYNHAVAWLEAGKPWPARGIVWKAQELWDMFPEHYIQLRRLWFEARAAAACGEVHVAVPYYHQAIDGLLKTGALRDAVHATVDLTTYLRLARNFEALRQLSTSVTQRLQAAVNDDTGTNVREVIDLLDRATTEPETVRLGELTRAVDHLREVTWRVGPPSSEPRRLS